MEGLSRLDVLHSKWQCQIGQAWLLGNRHRLVCGDATDPGVYVRITAGLPALPRLMVTDPPYGVRYDSTWRSPYSSGNYAEGQILNDNRADWREVWSLWGPQVLYVWHGALNASVVEHGLRSAGYVVRSRIIWAKPVQVFSRGHYHWQHEPCWYAVQKGKTANWQGDRKQTTVWRIGNGSSHGRTGNSLDDFYGGHIAQKPVEIFRRPILNHTQEHDVVADPFAGSGSAILAAESTGRTCVALDLDPRCCSLILERCCEAGLTIEEKDSFT